MTKDIKQIQEKCSVYTYLKHILNMTDLQKRIEELEKLAEQEPNFDPDSSNYDDFLAQGSINGEIFASKKALSIIKELQEEVERYKLLWETACEGARVIIAEQEEEIKQLKEKLNDN